MERLKDFVVTIPDFPKKGIMFRDVTPVIQSPEGFRMAVDGLSDVLKDVEYDFLVCSEARGFVFAAPLAYNARKGLVLIRKKGKLPREVYSQDYQLEYGVATMEIHRDAIKPGDKVVLIDDLLATGGTVMAMIKLIEKCGGIVSHVVIVMELLGLNGREVLKGYDVTSLIQYEGH